MAWRGPWKVAFHAAALAGATWTSHARAVDFDDRPLTVAGALGIGSPVGLAGAIVTYSPVGPFAVGAGIGTNAYGPEFSTLLTLRAYGKPWRVAHAFAGSLTLSTAKWRALHLFRGTLAEVDWDTETTYVSDRAYWVGLEGGYELLTPGGFSFRVTSGPIVMLNPGAAYCIGHGVRDGQRVPCDGDGPSESDTIGVSFYFALGYAFEL